MESQIAYYEQIIATSQDEKELYEAELWLEWAARQLGMIKEGDK